MVAEKWRARQLSELDGPSQPNYFLIFYNRFIMPRNHSRRGRSQLLKGKKGSMRPQAGNKPSSSRQQVLAARRRKIREREARADARARKLALDGARLTTGE